ncbi:hypothetical protein [Polyangium sp. 6x1]|uniref:hypothetical protein n=1 Tax=Polyangium sp. 6x1 TaxID=3042689 RepID=UPI002483055B|nr:hypothetical protein [Polyangium sp. 6x1]MDI1444204.1 hypothetical protein [Polyangium sp. 6x1]
MPGFVRVDALTRVNARAVIQNMVDGLEVVAGRAQPGSNARLDRIAEGLKRRRPGERVGRSDAFRIALERGMAALEDELGLGPMPSEEPRKTPARSVAKKGTKAPARKPAK